MSGIATLNRDASGAPRHTPIALADKFCGHALASAITMALYHRERTGEGQEIHLPMLETLLAFNLPEHLGGATLCEPALGLGYSRMLSPHRRPYATRDGHVCVMAVTDDQWHRLFGALGRPEMMRDPRFARLAERVANIGEAYAVLTETFPPAIPGSGWIFLTVRTCPAGRPTRSPSSLTTPILPKRDFSKRSRIQPKAGLR